MSYRHRIIGHERQPVQGHADWGLWTHGQRFRQDPTKTIEHTKKFYRNIDRDIRFVGSALNVVGDPNARFFTDLISSQQLIGRMDRSLDEAFVEIVAIRDQIDNAIANINVNQPHTTGPEGAFNIINREVSPRYDFVAPQELPQIIADFVEVTHEMEQYRSKEKRRTSGDFKERAKHHVGSIIGNDTTEQMIRLQEFTRELNPDRFSDFLVKYNRNAIVVNFLLELRNTQDLGVIRDRLANITREDLYNYSPYHTYAGGRHGTGNNQAPPGTGNAPTGPGPSTSNSQGPTSKKQNVNQEMINHFNVRKEELLMNLERIDSSSQTQNIAQINHDSIEFTRSMNTMSALANEEERKHFAKMIEEIGKAFEGKASKIDMSVRYISNTGTYDLHTQDANAAFEEWRQSVKGWHKDKEVAFVHSGGGLYTENEIDMLLEEKKKRFFNLYNKKLELYEALRDRGEGDGKPGKNTSATFIEK